MSLPPPAAYGTTKLMGRDGKPLLVVVSAVDVGTAAAALVAGAVVAPPPVPPPPHDAIVIARAEISASDRRRIAIPPNVSLMPSRASLYHRADDCRGFHTAK
jgi:hypothetical protein